MEIQLNADQQRAYDAVMSGNNVFLSGSGGTGKTTLLKCLIKDLSEQGKQVLVMSYTSFAANLLGGSTIHKVFGFPIGPCISEKHSKIIRRTNKELRAADIIIIDEISMVRIDMFDAIVASLEKVKSDRENRYSYLGKTGKPQLIVAGDFFQLPPVINNQTGERSVLESIYGTTIGNGYAFMSEGWWKCEFENIFLNEVLRQSNTEFIEHLNQIRDGNISGLSYFNNNGTQEIIPDAIHLFAYNKDVTSYNYQKLNSLPGEAVFFETISTLPDFESFDIPEFISLKVGARVIITKNESDGDNSEHVLTPSQKGKFFLYADRDVRYHNGSMGTVIDIMESKQPSLESVTVKIDHGDIVTFYREHFKIYRYVTDELDERKLKREVVGYYSQFPLSLGYAITIHKGQGQTYDAVNLNPHCFGDGQLYVALSRVRSIESMHLLKKISPRDVKTNRMVVLFYDYLKNSDKEFPYLKWNIEKGETKKLSKRSSKEKKAPIKKQYKEKQEEKPIESVAKKEILSKKSKPKSYTPSLNKDKGGRPNRFPNGQRQMRIPQELDDAIQRVIDCIYPKSSSKGINKGKLQKILDYIDIEFPAETYGNE